MTYISFFKEQNAFYLEVFSIKPGLYTMRPNSKEAFYFTISILGLGVILGTVLLFIIYFFIHKLLMPIKEIVRFGNNLAQNQMSESFLHTYKDEFYFILNNMTQMSKSIKNHHEDLDKKTKALNMTIEYIQSLSEQKDITTLINWLKRCIENLADIYSIIDIKISIFDKGQERDSRLVHFPDNQNVVYKSGETLTLLGSKQNPQAIFHISGWRMEDKFVFYIFRLLMMSIYFTLESLRYVSSQLEHSKMTAELEHAKTFQQFFLPTDFKSSRWDIDHVYRPLGRMSGLCLNYDVIENQMCFAIIDMGEASVQNALLAAVVMGAMQALIPYGAQWGSASLASQVQESLQNILNSLGQAPVGIVFGLLDQISGKGALWNLGQGTFVTRVDAQGQNLETIEGGEITLQQGQGLCIRSPGLQQIKEDQWNHMIREHWSGGIPACVGALNRLLDKSPVSADSAALFVKYLPPFN